MSGATKLAALVAAAALTGCSPEEIPYTTHGTISFTPIRPALPNTTTVTPYTGGNELVDEAVARFRTGMDLQQKVIYRSCGAVGGVCHNQKEYPDLHTATTFASAIGAPCNVQPGSYGSVFDRCERLGDRFRMSDRSFAQLEVGWIDFIRGESVDFTDQNPPTATSPGLHLYLRDPLPSDVEGGWDTGLFIRTFVNGGNVETLPFANFTSSWWILSDRRHLVAEVRNDQLDDVTALLAAGIVQGDHNRNGRFGAQFANTVTLLNPGKPEESYLVGRLRGTLQGERVPGTRMPLANVPPSVTEMLALMCFIEGLPVGQAVNLDSPIDYANCSYSADPAALNLVGTGVTWSGRVRPLLQSNCGGCHGGATPHAGLDLLTDEPGNLLYTRLLRNSTQRTEMPLLLPGQPTTSSYLWHKLSGGGSILGQRMPIDPVNGNGQLPQADLDDIETWISFGAPND